MDDEKDFAVDEPEETAVEAESDDAREVETPVEPEQSGLELPPIDDEDDAEYSRRVQKRIKQEIGKRKLAEDRENQLAAQLATLRADLDHIKQRNAVADAQVVEGSLQTRLQQAQNRLKTAKEDGDIEAELAAMDDYTDLRAQKRDWDSRQKTEPAPSSPVAPTGTPAGAAQWLERNSWYLSGQHPRAAKIALELDSELQQEGYSPNDPGMYAELNRRLKAAMPKMADLLGDVATPASRPRQPGPPTGASSPDGRSAGGGPRRSLTQADLTEMTQFGMNPNSKEDRLAWLRTHQ